MVPAMVFLLGMSQHIAEGTSLMAILFTADAGTRVNLKNQRVDLRQTAMIGLGGILFALVGGVSDGVRSPGCEWDALTFCARPSLFPSR